jgi:heptosyltransferase-2
MHIASALGVPTVAVFGATDHETTGPSGPIVRVVREPVECSPCFLRECPIDHRCMIRVSAERVALEALDLLK